MDNNNGEHNLTHTAGAENLDFNPAEEVKHKGGAVEQRETMAEQTAEPQLVMNKDLVSEEYKTAIKGSLKIMDGRYGGGFFARYIINTGNMYSWLNLVIVYPDGLAKNIVLYKNYFKETDVESGDGVCTATPEKKRSNLVWDIGDGDLRNFVQFPQYETPAMPIPAEALWERLCKNKRRIPYVYLHGASTTREIYEALKAAATELSMEYEKGFMVSSDRFLVEKPLFEEIVKEHGRIVCQIRTEFDMLDLFFKDKGKGYQFTKKVNGENKRFYAIRNEYPAAESADGEIDALEDTSYEWSSDESKKDRELSRTKSELANMTSKYNVLANKYNKLAQVSGIGKVDLEI